MAQPWGLIIILLMRKCQRPEIKKKSTFTTILKYDKIFLLSM